MHGSGGRLTAGYRTHPVCLSIEGGDVEPATPEQQATIRT